MTTEPALLAARARCEAAKLRLDLSLAEAKARLEPRTLARDTVAGVKATVANSARNGVAAARKRPAITAGIVGVLGLFLARRPVIAKARKLLRRDATAADS